MKRTAGDIWVMEKPVVTNQFFFTYKFALFDSNRKFLHYEKGIDRIADMELLDEAPAKYPREFYDYRSGRNLQTEPAKDYIKRTELHLGWEMFRVTFSVSYPIEDPNNQMVLMGSKPETTNIAMQMLPRSLNWMHNKYGDDTQPYEVVIKMKNNEGGVNGTWKEDAANNQFNYHYDRYNRVTGEKECERMPKRKLTILNPNEYTGSLGLRKCSFWYNTDRVFIVNGFCNKADGNFLGQFNLKTIGDTNICLGSYTLHEQDVARVYEERCNAVLNIMTEQDMRQRGINWSQMCNWYHNRGINSIIHDPVCDNMEAEYCDDLFRAAIKLYELNVIQGKKVFLNCTAGVSRGPTLLIIYLALFIRHPSWRNIEELYNYVEEQYEWQDANMKIAALVIHKNKDFQENQYKMFLEDEERRKREAEELERQRQLGNAQDESERIRLLRLREAEAEKLRLQRLAVKEAERMKIEQHEEDKIDRERRNRIKQEFEDREAELRRLRQ